MTDMSHPSAWGRVLAGALIGAVTALILGLVAVQLAPDNGFADLAAAAVTRVILVPLGGALGALIAYRYRH